MPLHTKTAGDLIHPQTLSQAFERTVARTTLRRISLREPAILMEVAAARSRCAHPSIIRAKHARGSRAKKAGKPLLSTRRVGP